AGAEIGATLDPSRRKAAPTVNITAEKKARRSGAPGKRTGSPYLVTVTFTVLSPALLRKNSEPVPGLPPWTGTVTLLALAGTKTSGITTLSFTSVVTSISI